MPRLGFNFFKQCPQAFFCELPVSDLSFLNAGPEGLAASRLENEGFQATPDSLFSKRVSHCLTIQKRTLRNCGEIYFFFPKKSQHVSYIQKFRGDFSPAVAL